MRGLWRSTAGHTDNALPYPRVGAERGSGRKSRTDSLCLVECSAPPGLRLGSSLPARPWTSWRALRYKKVSETQLPLLRSWKLAHPTSPASGHLSGRSFVPESLRPLHVLSPFLVSPCCFDIPSLSPCGERDAGVAHPGVVADEWRCVAEETDLD